MKIINLKCVKCGKATCDCWEPCECGWIKEVNAPCDNPVHSHPFTVLAPLVDWYYRVGKEYGVYRTVAATKKAIFAAIESGNIFLLRADAKAAASEAKALGVTIEEFVLGSKKGTQ